MRVRNFWQKSTSGYWLPDNTFVEERTVQNGPRRIVGGLKLEVFQRTCGEPHGAQQIFTGEGHAGVDGRLVFRLFDPQGRVIWISESHRDGKG
jgi:hypothetical protein